MKAKKLFAVLLAAVSLFTFCACGGTTDEGKLPDGKQDEVTDNLPEENPPVENPPEETPPEVETPPEETLSEAESNEIKEAYAKLRGIDVEDVRCGACYGKFDGTYVLMICAAGDGVSSAVSHLTVEGITFLFPNGAQFDVYREGKFYEMQEAYDAGLLSKDNLYSVWENHRENRHRSPRGPVELDAKTEWEIVNAYIACYSDPSLPSPLTDYEVFLNCYGAFDGVYVFFSHIAPIDWVYDGPCLGGDVVERVAGLDFICNPPARSFDIYFRVYADGKIYSLTKAYDEGLLSKDNLYSVWEKHREKNTYFYSCGPVELDANVDKEIRTAYAALYTDGHPVWAENVSLRCFGAFDGVYVLFVDAHGFEYFDYNDAIHRETVSGIEFIYSSSQTLTVYSNGEFCSLSEAYENKLLSHDELLTTQINYRARNENLYR